MRSSQSVVHFATGSIGGAGLAALRAYECLVFAGYPASFVSPDRSLRLTSDSPKMTYQKIRSRAVTALQSRFVQREKTLFTPISVDFEVGELPQNAIAHIHAFYNLFSPKSILRMLDQKTIFFSLHDERLMSGGCHYMGECSSFKENCFKCPQTHEYFHGLVRHNRELQNKIISHENTRIVSPSTWLLKKLSSTGHCNPKNVFRIVNPIPQPSIERRTS